MTKVTIDKQITAVELALLSYKAHLDNLKRLVAKKQRDQHEVDMIEPRIPALDAALQTLRWLKENETKIKSGMKELKQLEKGEVPS